MLSRSIVDRYELGVAAASPSDQIYWISEEAYETASSKRTWKWAERREGEEP